MSEVTRLLHRWNQGDRAVRDRLLSLVYDELRRLAAGKLRGERSGHTLQPTALVHEAYLRLVDQREVPGGGRAHFISLAAKMMRRVLVDHARKRLAAKRDAGIRVSLSENTPVHEATEITALDEALNRLAQLDPRQVRIIELRYFGGMSIEETASLLDISPATVKREWRVGKMWLYREVSSNLR